MEKRLRIGVVAQYNEHEYYAILLKSIYEALTKNNSHMVVLCTYQINDISRLHLFASNHIDGWIMLPPIWNASFLDFFVATGKPVVIVGENCTIDQVSGVYANNRIDGEKIVDHLIEHGHRDIAFVAWFQITDFLERYEGYKMSLKKNNIPFQEHLVYQTDNCFRRDGYLLGLKMAEEGIAFTAVFAANDYLALGLMDAFLETGYRIPEDIAIFGFDNIREGKDNKPYLSTVMQNIKKIGIQSVDIIIKKIVNQDAHGENCYVDDTLIFRGSCGCEDTVEQIDANIEVVERLVKKVGLIEESIFKRDYVGLNLMKANMDQIKENIITLNEGRRIQCVGIWEKNVLQTRFYLDATNLSQYKTQDVMLEDFPTLDFLNLAQEDEVVWIHHISSDKIDMGALSYTEKFYREAMGHSFFVYDMLTFALDREQLSQEMHAKDLEYRNLINNSGQGFLTVGEALVVNAGYNIECERIFQKNIEGAAIGDILFETDPEQKEYLSSIMTSILNDAGDKTNIYLSLLPPNLYIGNRYIQIEYKIIYNIHNEKSLMLIFTDITDKKELEGKIEHERNILKMVVYASTHRSEFLENISDFQLFCSLLREEELKKSMKENIHLEDLHHQIARTVHTLKGNFSQMDMSNTVRNLHEFEEKLHVLHKNLMDMTADEYFQFFENYNYNQWIEKDLSIIEKILGKEYCTKSKMIMVDEEKIIRLEELTQNALSEKDCNKLLPGIRGLRECTMKDMMEIYPRYVKKLAEKYNKQINDFTIQGDTICVDRGRYHDFIKSLVHVFRNAVDHGIEDPYERLLQGKEEKGTISCRVEKMDNAIILTISDDGQGIDLNSIEEKAIEKGLCDKNSSHRMEPQELINFMFLDEFSLSKTVTDLSGRGEGLAAVKNEIEKLNGRIDVISEPRKGTTFRFTIPKG